MSFLDLTDAERGPQWLEAGWRAEVDQWLGDRLAAAGIVAAGPLEQSRVRSWGTVLHVETDQGRLWLKANGAASAYEAGLVAALAEWQPEHVVAPVAVDTARGWLLMRDGGATLRDARGGATPLAEWQQLLVEYAGLQRVLSARADELLLLGVPDHTPQRLPDLLRGLLDDTSAMALGLPDIGPEQLGRLRADLPAYAEMCDELAASGIAPTLQHNDLHDNNAFVGDGRYRVFDWGDAVVGLPFTTLLVTLRSVAHQHGMADDDPGLLRLRDAYLEPWTTEHDPADLRRWVHLAIRTGVVSRALSWRSALAEATEAALAEDGDAVPGWLLELYEPTAGDPRGWSAPGRPVGADSSDGGPATRAVRG